MTAKKWSITFIIIVVIVLLGIAILNLVVDPYGYFDALDGENEAMSDNHYIRVLKAKHIEKYGDEYDAYLIGGSKAGVFTSEQLSRLDGYNYYNAFITCGNYEEYYLYTEFIVENTNAKKIVLNLSGFECIFATRDGVKQQTPAVISGKSQIAEFITFLFKNPSLSIGEIFNPTNDHKQNADGSRNLDNTYVEYWKDPDAFVQNNVIYDLNEDLEKMFKGAETRTFSSMDNDIKYLRQIVELCEENDIELLVINNATPITSRQSYEGETYWNFLVEMASITEYWDFTSYNDINLNPYNFYDDAHPFNEVVDLMIDTITGEDSYEGFGQYVTMDNVYEYISQRRTDFYELKAEYEETGTIQLGGRYDDSNLVKEESEDE